MKAFFISIISTLLLSGCYTTLQQPYLEPSKSSLMFKDNNQIYSYKYTDSVVVSLAYLSIDNRLSNFSLVVDNQSNDTLIFDPANIYTFNYLNDSVLFNSSIVRPTNADTLIENLHKEVCQLEKKQVRNQGLSILFGAICLTAQVATLASDVNVSNDIADLNASTQEIMYDTREYRYSKIDECHYKIDGLNKNSFFKTAIPPYQSVAGTIYLELPNTSKYLIYVPVKDRILRFSFNNTTKQ